MRFFNLMRLSFILIAKVYNIILITNIIIRGDITASTNLINFRVIIMNK